MNDADETEEKAPPFMGDPVLSAVGVHRLFRVYLYLGHAFVGSVNGVHITLPGGDTYSFEDEASIELYVGAVLDASPLNEPAARSGERAPPSSPLTAATGQSNTGCMQN